MFFQIRLLSILESRTLLGSRKILQRFQVVCDDWEGRNVWVRKWRGNGGTKKGVGVGWLSGVADEIWELKK